MEMYLQFGYGMMAHCRVLISAWGGGTVILSPRDLEPEQLPRMANSINRLANGAVLLDPQFYLPDADHARLCSHSYWPQQYETGLFWQGTPLIDLLTELCQTNQTLECREFILPGRLASAVDQDWLSIQQMTLEAARNLGTDIPLMPTIALSPDAIRSEEQIALLLEHASRWRAHSYYLVCQHPNGNYLVDDPSWLANILDLVAGLRLSGSRVVLGYCNHQMLIAATAKATAIASGTWMNVRSFPPDKFRVSVEDERRNRATWYYCPRALSEYKLPFLDIAQTQGVLGEMQPPPEEDSGMASVLFGGGQPSNMGFLEPEAFRHYLLTLKRQVEGATASTFDEAIQQHDIMLDRAEALLSTLTASRVRGQQRDFSDVIDVNRAALGSHIAKRGAMLRRRWNSI